MTDQVTVSETIAAPAEKLYDMVSDLPRMGEWSPENRGGRWLDGAHGPAAGARFRGNNAHGWRRWSTTVTVTAAEPGRRFAFHVSYGPVGIADWSYEFAPAADAGTTVTQSWTDLRPQLLQLFGKPVTGVGDRATYNRQAMRTTLANLKRDAESAAVH